MMKKEFAVIGLGRFGGSIVRELIELDCDVLAIDIDEERVKEYQDIATRAVIANTTEEQVLKDLGLRNFDNVVVAIGDHIQESILTSLLLKDIGVKRVTVKAKNNYHARVLEKIGADIVVHPERDMGRRIAHKLTSSSVLDYLELSDDHSIGEYIAGSKFNGRTLLELNVRKKFGVNVIAVKREDDIMINPNPKIKFNKDDILIIIGSDHDLNHFEKKMM